MSEAMHPQLSHPLPTWNISEDHPAPTRLIRMPEVEHRTALKKTALYTLIRAKKFPSQVKIAGQTAFVEHEVEAWIQGRIRERDERDEDEG